MSRANTTLKVRLPEFTVSFEGHYNHPHATMCQPAVCARVPAWEVAGAVPGAEHTCGWASPRAQAYRPLGVPVLQLPNPRDVLHTTSQSQATRSSRISVRKQSGATTQCQAVKGSPPGLSLLPK